MSGWRQADPRKRLVGSLLAVSVFLGFQSFPSFLSPAVRARAGESPARVPPELAEALSAAQADLQSGEPQKAVERLRAFRGEDHALRHLVLGHAYAQQSRLELAASAYRDALALDGDLKPAGIALAKVYALEEEWSGAAGLLGRFVSVSSCELEDLLLYAEVARKLEDRRLLSLLVRTGILRFPGDRRLRRLDLALLSEENEHRRASQTVLLLLEETPTDPALWQQLAYARGELGETAGRLAALEASVLADPGNLARCRQFFSALLAAGDWLTVLQEGRALLAGDLAGAARRDPELMDLLVCAADRGERDEVLGAWLALVEEKDRTRNMQVAAARLALRRGEPAAAREALRALIEAGDSDPSVYLWAGHLAELAEEWPEAETLYDHARTLKGPDARLALLYLARLHLRNGHPSRAVELLEPYLDSYPEDAPARALLALAKGRSEEN
jgi:predicted Zn-dependent protease